MNKIFFISDLHLYHSNVIKYCNRPFIDIIDMNKYILDCWNNTIDKNDTIYFLGDFALGQCDKAVVYEEYSKLLNGKLFFLKGNHDQSYINLVNYFTCIKEGYIVDYKGYHFILSHFPLPDDVIPVGYFNIHGHIHNARLNLDFNPDYHINVSADTLNFVPISIDSIVDYIEEGVYKAKTFIATEGGKSMRKLATIEKIIDIQPIPDADAIEVAVVKGWKVVVRKNEFSIGESVVYFEIDSLIPRTDVTEFLMKKPEDKEARLKTVKLRKQLSQGLILSLGQAYSMHHELNGDDAEPFGESIGTDLSDILHIEKWEPEVKYSDEGLSVEWPFTLSKTDEERIQNIPEVIDDIIASKEHLCISVKLDGTSMTVVQDKSGEVHVAGRNYDYLKEDPAAYSNKYWSTAKKYNIPEKLNKLHEQNPDRLYAIQGELVGPGIQKNKMNLSELHFYIFNLFVSDNKGASWEKQGYNELIQFCVDNELEHVPYIYSDYDFILNNIKTVDDILKLAEGTYRDNAEGYFPNAKEKQQREGLVFRTLNHSKSFKCINNLFLLEGGD